MKTFITKTKGEVMNRNHFLKGLTVFLCSLLLTAQCIFAQLPIIGGVKEGVYCSGTADNFNCPEEPTTPDAALVSMLSAQYDSCFEFIVFDEFPGQLDCVGIPIFLNAMFVHRMTFAVPAGGVASATLVFRAKASPFGQTNTDFIAFFEGSTYLTGSNLKLLPEASGTWDRNQDETFSLDLSNLPSGFSPNNILQYLNDGDLDVVIGNETAVDWMCLYIPTAGCLGNIVQNWSFIDGAVAGPMPSPGQTGNWTLAYGTPDVSVGDACGDSATVAMWGNKVAGEAIQQTLAFAQGWTYAVKFCAKWALVPGRPYPVKFEFRASNLPLTSPTDPNGVRIGVSAPVTPQQLWMSMGPILWTATGTYSILTVSATNQSSASHPDSTSYGAIDRICIYKFMLGDANGDGVIDISDVVYLLNYLFINGPAPVPLAAGDATCDGVVDASDLVYLLNYLFAHGPAPEC
jgi:hypothetical protein